MKHILVARRTLIATGQARGDFEPMSMLRRKPGSLVAMARMNVQEAPGFKLAGTLRNQHLVT
jgi:hypothetical protein